MSGRKYFHLANKGLILAYVKLSQRSTTKKCLKTQPKNWGEEMRRYNSEEDQPDGQQAH